MIWVSGNYWAATSALFVKKAVSNETETIEHLLYYCSQPKRFTQIEEYLNSAYGL